ADEAVLGGVVGGPVRYRDKACDRSDIDDGTATGCKHFFAEGAGQKEGRDKIDVDYAAVVTERSLLGGTDEADAGVVDQDVGTSEASEDGFGEIGDGGFEGDVASVTHDRSAVGVDGLDGR